MLESTLRFMTGFMTTVRSVIAALTCRVQLSWSVDSVRAIHEILYFAAIVEVFTRT